MDSIIVDKVIFITGLVLFMIALFLLGFMLIEYFREKEKLLQKAQQSNAEGQINRNEEAELTEYREYSRQADTHDFVRTSASSRASGSLSFDRPGSGVFSITLPSPARSIEGSQSRSSSRWSREVKELCSFTQPIDDLPPSYSESFRYPVLVHQQAQ